MESDVRGITSHGVNRLYLYCHDLERKTVDGAGTPVVESETDAVAMVDGRNAQGAVVGEFCMRLAMAKARAAGVGWVVAHHTNHYGIAGWYAQMATAEGMLGFSFTNTSPVGVPTRAARPALGTNPIACAGPTLGDPVVLDMSTTTVPSGRVEVLHRKGQQAPPGWGVDSDGLPTTDPQSIFSGGLTYLGGSEETSGYKGYGLALMVEMLCGVLAGADFGPSVGQVMNPNAVGRSAPVNLGQCFIALDPARFCPGYAQRLDTLVQQLHALPLAPGAPGPVLVPGEKEQQTAKQQREHGISVHVKVAATLVELGEQLGVDVSSALRGAAAK